MLAIDSTRAKVMLGLTLPIITALVAQNLIGFIDAIMIGRLGDSALASAGVANFIFVLFLTFPLGIGAGVQAFVARRVGEGRSELAGQDLTLGLIIACSSSVFLAIACYYFLPLIFPLISKDAAVSRLGIEYLQGRIPSMLFTSALVCFRSFWNGMGLAKKPLIVLYFVLLTNVILNYALIFGHFGAPELGLFGAGLASTLASIFGVILFLFLGRDILQRCGFAKAFPARERALKLLAISVPESINLFFISLALLVLFFIVGQLGVMQMAVLHILVNFILIAHLFVEGFGISALTLVGQSLGRRDIQSAKGFGWDAAKIGATIVFILGLSLNIFPEQILSVFLTKASSVEYGVMPMRLLGMWIWIDVFGKIISFALIGAGATKLVLSVMFCMYWFFCLPFQWFVGVKLDMGLNGIFFVPLVVSIIGCITFSYVWQKGSWSTIEI